ncbi:mono/diheme cytochrome c family protein [Brevirhabdus pacifica]|uniref:c-type cytochrome n=1 Tax=Brevirhabdus pacifica TaxID=1267768 RepID=UPI000CABA26B|nr:cytochrome c [Brevirhabdus pacifica]PJJ86412.1 mono/diheme cytochrome c family protein [Brevirhabdus pacifica]
MLRKAVGLAAAAALTGGAAVAALVVWPVGRTPDPIPPEGNVERGAYLARASGCIACHTDFEKGGAPLAGGAPLKTDFGVFYPPNLTSDKVHGIGDWSREDFAKAIRQGVSPEGEPYYPTFTYPFYANFTDQDIADLYAAFTTVPPVAEETPEHEVSFPFDQRWGLKLWRASFLERPLTDPDPGRSELWNRGKELVNGAAHCGACHTGRNFAGARVSEARFEGSDSLPGGRKSPSIRARDLRERGWTVSNLAYALQTGLTPEGDAFGGSMAEVVQNGTSFLRQEDLTAMATYLLEAEAVDTAMSGAADPAPEATVVD